MFFVILILEYLDYLYANKLIDEFKNGMYVPYPMKNVDYAKRGVHIVDYDWNHYDRASFPVYQLENLDRETIWDLFIRTAQQMNKSWLSYCGFESISQVPEISGGYREYLEENYRFKG